MKLLYRVVLRVSLALILIMAAWAVFFYMAMMNEVNDEIDDSLSDYAETIMIRSLAGEELPVKDNGSNNQYFLSQVSEQYAHTHPKIVYTDSMVYIGEKGETEPARILTMVFRDKADLYYQLTVLTPTIEKKDLRESILFWIVFLYLSLLLTVILINAWVFYRNTRPLRVLLNWLDNYRIGKKNIPLNNDTRIIEFRKLNEAVLRNAARAEQQFEQQKQFISNASHEMQTPLAVCRNRLELLMEDGSLSEKQLVSVDKTLQTLEHITRLNKSLLLLSKIDNDQFPDVNRLNLNNIIERLLSDYEEVYAYKQIHVSVEDAGTFELLMNESLAVILITNLLKNGYVHNREGGFLNVRISPDEIIFRNSGSADSLDEKRIFDRFYQGNKKEGSTGLGLAIANSICRLQKINLSYSYDGEAHVFTLKK